MEPDLNKMKVKVLFLSLLMCGTLAACGSDDDEMSYVTTDPFLNQNNITDVARLYWDIAVDENTVLYWGNRKGKEWFALFDKGNGALLKEWYGKEQNDNGPFYHRGNISVKRFKSNTIAFLRGNEGGLVLLHENQKVEYCTFMDGTSYLIKGIISEDRCLCSNGNIESIFDFKGNMIAEDAAYAGKEVYTGFQDNKLWAGYCDANGDFKEMRTLDDFERDRTYQEEEYDEYEEFHVDVVGINNYVQKDGYGYAILPRYIDYIEGVPMLALEGRDVLFLNEKDGVIYVHYHDECYGILDDWYEDSIILWHSDHNNHSLSVFTMKGEKIVDRVNLRCSTDNIYDVYGVYPIAYDEAICFCRIGGVSALRNNFSSETTIWSTGVEKLNKVPSDARITFTLKEKNAQSWLVQCDVVNRDGSKSEFSFHLNIETGEIQYVS